MSWLAVIKHAAFVREFVVDVLRSKIAAFDSALRPSDYANFVAQRVGSHPELIAISPSTQKKIELVLIRMLVEAGLIVTAGHDRRIERPVLSSLTVRAIATDNPQHLAGFLWTDEELAGITARV